MLNGSAESAETHAEADTEAFCDGRNSTREREKGCSVRYVGGELFLAISPALLHSASYGLLQTDEHELTLQLYPGWEQCMPPLAGHRGITRLDQLLAWLMHQAGRRDGFLAHSPLEHTDADADRDRDSENEIVWRTLDLSQCNEFLAPKAALGGGACQLARYEPSTQIKLFLCLEMLTVLVILVEIYLAWMHAKERLFSDTAQQFSSLLLPFASLSGVQTKRNRAAAIARHVRSKIRDGYHIRCLRHLLVQEKKKETETDGQTEDAVLLAETQAEKQIEVMQRVAQLIEQIDASDAAETDATERRKALELARQQRDKLRQEFWSKVEHQRGFAEEVPFLLEAHIQTAPSIVRRTQTQKHTVMIDRPNVMTNRRVTHRNVHYPVNLEARLNVQLTRAEFFDFLQPSLVEVQRERELQGESPNAGCGRLLTMVFQGEYAWEKKVCDDIFDMIDVDGSSRVSFDELERYLLYFQASSDGEETAAADDEEEEGIALSKDEAGELLRMGTELASDLHTQREAEELLECMAESDLDHAVSNPGGINMAADMLFGGPVKVCEHYFVSACQPLSCLCLSDPRRATRSGSAGAAFSSPAWHKPALCSFRSVVRFSRFG